MNSYIMALLPLNYLTKYCGYKKRKKPDSEFVVTTWLSIVGVAGFEPANLPPVAGCAGGRALYPISYVALLLYPLK